MTRTPHEQCRKTLHGLSSVTQGNCLRLILILLMVTAFFATGCGAATAGNTTLPNEKTLPSPTEPNSLSIEECVGLVLIQSPYMKLHDLKIDIKGLDAEDAWYQMFPKINLALIANAPINKGQNSKDPSFSATLTSGSYDPISANITHDAQLKLIQLAKYAKLETATELIQNTAASYLREKAHAARMRCFEELLKLTRENLAFVVKSYPDAPTIPLDVRLAEHKIEQLKAEKARLLNTRMNEQIRLKRLLGIPVEQKLQLQADSVEEMLFRTFDPGKLTFAQIRKDSIKAKMEELSMELAENNILAAWAKYIPKFNFSVRTPDPINNDNKKDDSYYFTLGLSAPLWYWGELERGRQRAQLQKQQTRLNSQANWLELEDAWYTIRSNVQFLRDSCKLADAETEMHELGVRKAEIMFNVGRIKYDNYLKTRVSLIRNQIDAINAQEAYSMAKLDAFAKSGELLRRFVAVVEDNDVEN
jgi:outer membrane protein TolC